MGNKSPTRARAEPGEGDGIPLVEPVEVESVSNKATDPAGRATTVFVSLSTVLITIAAVLATVIMGLNKPVGGNECLTTPTSTGIDNYRWGTMSAYAIAVVMLFALRLKRIDQGHIAGYDIVGVFNGRFKNFKFVTEFGKKDHLLRTAEFIFHVLAIISSLWFLINNQGLSECHDAVFSAMMTVCFVAYYLCFSSELIDGLLPGQYIKKRPAPIAVDPKDLKQTENVTFVLAGVVIFLATVNLGFVFARLHHSHLSDVQCHDSVNILLSILFLLSMVTWVSYSGTFVSPNAHYRLSRWHPNTVPAFSALVSALVVTYQFAVYENSATVPSTLTPHDYTGKQFCILVNATITPGTPSYYNTMEDKTGDFLLEAHFWTLLLLSVGVAFIKRALSTFRYEDFTEAADASEPSRTIGYTNTGLRPNTSASTLAHNRLAGDDKKPYTSVSTLQFV